jgi:hypothetical protein
VVESSCRALAQTEMLLTPFAACGTRPLRRAFLTSQPKWQVDLPELARSGTLFLGKASTGKTSIPVQDR